jgi:hypothetical protein
LLKHAAAHIFAPNAQAAVVHKTIAFDVDTDASEMHLQAVRWICHRRALLFQPIAKLRCLAVSRIAKHNPVRQAPTSRVFV